MVRWLIFLHCFLFWPIVHFLRKSSHCQPPHQPGPPLSSCGHFEVSQDCHAKLSGYFCNSDQVSPSSWPRVGQATSPLCNLHRTAIWSIKPPASFSSVRHHPLRYRRKTCGSIPFAPPHSCPLPSPSWVFPSLFRWSLLSLLHLLLLNIFLILSSHLLLFLLSHLDPASFLPSLSLSNLSS